MVTSPSFVDTCSLDLKSTCIIQHMTLALDSPPAIVHLCRVPHDTISIFKKSHDTRCGCKGCVLKDTHKYSTTKYLGVWFAVVDRTLSISLRPRGKINNNQVDYN